MSGPLPTYYPGTLQRSEARELVVGRGSEVTEANLRLVEGMLSMLDVTVTHTDGRPADSAMLTVSSVAEPPLAQSGRGIRNGAGRLELPPGDTHCKRRRRAVCKTLRIGSTYDLRGVARVRLTAGARENVTVVVGMSATASGQNLLRGR